MNIEIKEVSSTTMQKLLDGMDKAHWEEVPFGDYDLALDIDFAQYKYLYDAGYCKILAAFDDESEALVGYMTLMSSIMLRHKDTYQANIDCFYVAPEYRKMGVFELMLKEATALCRDYNIRFLSVGVNPQFNNHQHIEDYLLDCGYLLTEYHYTTDLGNKSGG